MVRTVAALRKTHMSPYNGPQGGNLLIHVWFLIGLTGKSKRKILIGSEWVPRPGGSGMGDADSSGPGPMLT